MIRPNGVRPYFQFSKWGLTLFRGAFGAIGCLAAAVPCLAQAPNLDWRTIKTRHFYVHFNPNTEPLARRLAADAERAYEQLSHEMHPPRGMIDLVLSDDVDFSNGFATPYQKMRAGLGLLNDGGNKAVIVSFSINGEMPEGPGHGFVVAYDVRGLNRDPGFTPTPAVWNVTPGGGAGGVWMSGSGPAIDGSDIYFTTGNGMDPGRMAGNFAESFVKLRYTPGAANVDNGKPKLTLFDFWGAFSDFDRADRDQDLGAAGVFIIPERGNLVGGGKDGILYNLDKNNLGKDTWTPQFNLPFVATYPPNAPNGAAGSSRATDPSSCAAR